MASFCKNGDCPPSQDLLAFLDGEIPVYEGAALRSHLADCEFCAAELDFYERYPQTDEPPVSELPLIPKPLYELAEALLTRAREGSLENMFGEVHVRENSE